MILAVGLWVNTEEKFEWRVDEKYHKKEEVNQRKGKVVRVNKANLRSRRLNGRLRRSLILVIDCVMGHSRNVDSICVAGLLKIKKVTGNAKRSAILEITWMRSLWWAEVHLWIASTMITSLGIGLSGSHELRRLVNGEIIKASNWARGDRNRIAGSSSMACATSFRDSGKIRHSWYAIVGMNEERHSSVISPKKNVVGRMCELEQSSAINWARSEVPEAPWTRIIHVEVVCSFISFVTCVRTSLFCLSERLGSEHRAAELWNTSTGIFSTKMFQPWRSNYQDCTSYMNCRGAAHFHFRNPCVRRKCHPKLRRDSSKKRNKSSRIWRVV